MDNQNNGLPQGVITSSTLNSQPTAAPQKKKLAFKKPNLNKKTIIIIVAVVVALFVVVNLFSSGKKLFNKNNNQQQENQIIEVDLPTEWGKTFALEAQKIYTTYETDRFDIAFINLDFANEPEMIIKYIDKAKKENIVIYSIDQRNGRVKESKHFGSADIKLLYSLVDGDAAFYINIIKSNKYGTYTLLSKVIAGTVVNPDILATNDKEVNAFAEKYVVANYSIVFYQVKKDNYAENFKTMYERYDKYAQEVKDKINELKDKYGKEEEKTTDDKPYLVTGNYYLTYGDYEHEPVSNKKMDDVESTYANTIATLNKDNTIIIKGITYKFTVGGNVLTLENGWTIKVDKENHFVLSDEGGTAFICKDPYDRKNEEKPQEEPETPDDNNPEEKPQEETPSQDE